MRYLLVVWLAAVAAAQQPSLSNAKVQEAPASGGLESALRTAMGKQSGPAWIGYAVPKIPGDGQACCWGSNNGYGCGLEGQRNSAMAPPQGPVKLEGPTHIAVLFRVEQGTTDKLRVFSIDCPLDAGGLPFHWLTGVRPAESVAMLVKHAEGGANTGKKASDSAVHAIAMHSGQEAGAALERFATTSQSIDVRKKAIFWLANSRGTQGYQVVSRVVREDASEKVREHATFALTQSKEPQAVAAIIRAAKDDKHPHVRGQALFWLAQKASKQAIGPINEALERDPETEVKKKAVFALTQLENGEGIPALIQVARTNQNPAVKKQAMFWLGQSKDPRALKYLEEILAR